MDKTVLGFIADVLYYKGIFCYEELEAIMNAKNEVELGEFIEKLNRGEFNVLKKGEARSAYKLKRD